MKKRTPLLIESTGGRNLGRCYNSMTYKITSTVKLKAETINALWKNGFLGYGQEFRILSTCDGSEEPAGIDEEVVTPYTYKHPYYEYKTEARVDSSD